MLEFLEQMFIFVCYNVIELDALSFLYCLRVREVFSSPAVEGNIELGNLPIPHPYGAYSIEEMSII